MTTTNWCGLVCDCAHRICDPESFAVNRPRFGSNGQVTGHVPMTRGSPDLLPELGMGRVLNCPIFGLGCRKLVVNSVCTLFWPSFGILPSHKGPKLTHPALQNYQNDSWKLV